MKRAKRMVLDVVHQPFLLSVSMLCISVLDALWWPFAQKSLAYISKTAKKGAVG